MHDLPRKELTAPKGQELTPSLNVQRINSQGNRDERPETKKPQIDKEYA